MSEHRGFTAELVDEADPEIGQERIRIRFDDGRLEEFRLHDYERLYALPGVYEEIVQERLGCSSPRKLASMLAAAVAGAGWDRSQVRVLDLAAGNGVSGEALAAAGLRPVLGTDIVPTARDAAERDRPGVYDDYLTLDLLVLSAQQRQAIVDVRANVLSCVAPVGNAAGQLPPGVLISAAALLAADAIIAYLHDPALDESDVVTAELWSTGLGPGTGARELERRRYVHRRTVTGAPYVMDGVVWRLSRQAQ